MIRPGDRAGRPRRATRARCIRPGLMRGHRYWGNAQQSPPQGAPGGLQDREHRRSRQVPAAVALRRLAPARPAGGGGGGRAGGAGRAQPAADRGGASPRGAGAGGARPHRMRRKRPARAGAGGRGAAAHRVLRLGRLSPAADGVVVLHRAPPGRRARSGARAAPRAAARRGTRRARRAGRVRARPGSVEGAEGRRGRPPVRRAAAPRHAARPSGGAPAPSAADRPGRRAVDHDVRHRDPGVGAGAGRRRWRG